MPVTPEDVQKKTFTPVRLREGYDMGEVDQFLDEVEAELTRLHQEIDGGRSGADQLDNAAGDAAAPPATAAELAGELPPRSVPEASTAAARLLELATTSADQLVAEAQDSATKIVGDARTDAERLETDTLARTEQLEAEAKARLEALDKETADRRQQMLSDLEHDKAALSQDLEDLRAFEREYRTRLKAYFEAQLQTLDGVADTPAPPLTPSSDEEVPSRLRELLGDDA